VFSSAGKIEDLCPAEFIEKRTESTLKAAIMGSDVHPGHLRVQSHWCGCEDFEFGTLRVNVDQVDLLDGG